jgi:apolipoprotein N-acyltransferase
MRRIPVRFVVLAVISAALQILPFPIAGPVPLWRTAFAWIALLPLLYGLLVHDKQDRPLSVLQSAALGYLCGILWYAGNCYWIYQTMYLYGGLPKPVALGILFLFALYLGLYHALFAAIIGALRRSSLTRNQVLLLAPFAWVAVELARARITGFPWDLLGLTQIDNPVLARLAPYTGTYGLSFFIAFINALWLMRVVLRERQYIRPALTVTGIIVFLAYIFALHAIPAPQQNPTTATANLVQENLSVGAARTGPPETTQQLLDSFTHLSTHPSPTFLSGIPEMSGTPEVVLLHKGGPSDLPEGKDHTETWQPQTDLIVWPEAPSGFFTNDGAFLNQMHTLADTSHALLIIGSLGVDPNPQANAHIYPNPAALEYETRPYFLYDSATFFRPWPPVHTTYDGALIRGYDARYDKIHLVPFGEYVPFKDLFFFARKLTAGVGDMDRGTRRLVYPYDGHTYAAFVCYESIFGDEVRRFVQNGAEVLVNISDDGWYGDTGAAWQHLNMVRMRAIENHRWILRSTNTGVTAAIDPAGRVTVSAPRHIRTNLHVAFGYETATTFYTAHGDLFAYACTLITLAALAIALRRTHQP